jgi:hypothetical protein
MERKIATKVQKKPSRNDHLQRNAVRATVARHPLMALQQSVGSRAVQSLIRSPYIQAKLQISTPGDRFEQEADRVADTVMRMTEPQANLNATVSNRTQISRLQRKCSECEKEMQRQPVKDEEEEKLQRKAEVGGEHQASNGVQSQIDGLRGGGQPLPESARAYFEPRFGHDFSGVRLHTGEQAAKSARSVNARAFTVGQDVAFGAGQYSPETNSGKRLLAHELTHVVQQGGATAIARDPLIKSESKPITPVGTGHIQRDWLDDAEAAVSDTYTSTASAVGGAFDTVTSAVSAGAKEIANEVEGAATTASNVGSAVGSYASEVSKTVSVDPEQTRTNLISRVNATRQQVQNADPNAVSADPSQIAAMNRHISSLNEALPASSAAIPALFPLLVPIGEAIGELLIAIGAALLGASAAVILIIAIIILAIIALIIYLFKDTRKFPDPDAKTDPKDKADPKDKTDPKNKTDDPPPPLPDPRDRLKPDCCEGPTPRGEFPKPPKRFDKKHPYFKPGVVQVKDNRNKHTQNIKPTNGARCDVEFLRSVVDQNPGDFGPCLGYWIKAAKAGNIKYGSQLGSDTVSNYVGKVENIVMDTDNQLDDSTWFGDTGEPLGVDISIPTAPTITSNARIDNAPAQAHIIPIEKKP